MGDSIVTSRGAPAPVMAVFCLIAAATLLNLPDLVNLENLWLTESGHSHGPLVAGVTLTLIWMSRRGITCEQPAFAALPLLSFVLATTAWVAARAASIDLVCWALWPVLVWLGIQLAFGSRTARCVAFPVAYFLFSIPLIELLAAPLATLTVTVTSLLLRVAGLSSVTLGRIVTIPEGTFEIEDGCAGTHFLTVALAIGTLLAFLDRLTWRRTVIIVASSVLLALIANWLRVAAIIEIGHVTQMRSSLVRDHNTFGWLIFAFATLPLLPLARTLAADLPVRPQQAAAASTSLARSAAAVCIGAAALAVAPLWAAGIRHAASVQPVPQLTLPVLTGWQGQLETSGDWRPSFPGAAIERFGTFRSGVAQVDFYAAFFNLQTRGAKLIGYYSSVAGRGTWAERTKRVRDVPGKVVESVLVNKAGRERIVWYWFEVRGDRLTSPAAVKLRESLAVFGLPSRSGVVALSTPCEPSCEAAELTLADAYRQGLGAWTADAATR